MFDHFSRIKFNNLDDLNWKKGRKKKRKKGCIYKIKNIFGKSLRVYA